jgi:type VI secretion system secreted protein VgrG
LKDDNGKPVPNEPYELKLPNGNLSGGTLNDKGKARVEGIPKGQCEVRFPKRHKSEWRKA